MKTITIVADDRIGLLADISYILGKAKLNIESIGVEVVAGKAVVSLGVLDADKAKDVLTQNSYDVKEANVIVVKLTDEPGQFNTITSMLAKEGVDISKVHMLSRDGKVTVIGLTVDKQKKAEKLLEKYLISG